MIKMVDIVYYCHEKSARPQEVLDIHAPAFGFAGFIEPLMDVQFIKHLDYTGIQKINRLNYAFFKSRNRFWYIPFTTHRYIKKQQPDIVLVEGLLFPLQLICLKLALGKRCRFIARHHGEKPFKGIKLFFQKIADRYTDAYLFTSYNNATEWINTCIKEPVKCREVLEASTWFSRKEKLKSQAITGMTGEYNFLWVGRLIDGKDPFTVLNAFEKYASANTSARLYMIYQDDALLADIKKLIAQSETLTHAVKLVGKVDNRELADWYSAANFFISGSHAEAAGYALLEAMACGCIPVVTAIPSFVKMTDNGKYGYVYPVADADALSKILCALNTINIESQRQETEDWFRENLGFKNIAARIFDVCTRLYSIKR